MKDVRTVLCKAVYNNTGGPSILLEVHLSLEFTGIKRLDQPLVKGRLGSLYVFVQEEMSYERSSRMPDED